MNDKVFRRRLEDIEKARAKAHEDWLQDEMVKILPPELFLKAFGNDQCKAAVKQWLTRNGYQVEMMSGGCTETLTHLGKTISTFNHLDAMEEAAFRE